jgi:hypothetical protein
MHVCVVKGNLSEFSFIIGSDGMLGKTKVRYLWLKVLI